jgi:cobalt-zinc-cadmium efflux system protein
MAHHRHETKTGTTDGRLWASAALNLGITLVECAGGLWAGSLALLSDAAHNLADVGALGLAIFARRLGRRASTPKHTYGLRRAEIMAALLNAGGLIAISILIAREAVGRFFHPASVNAPVMLAAAAVALTANVASVFLLRKHRDEDINLRSAFLHLAQDAMASLAVLVAALFARTPVGIYVDPAAAVLIGVVVLRSSISIVRESLHTLLEAAPPGVDVKQLAQEVAGRFPRVRLHHLHVWEVGPGQRALTAHMKVGGMSLMEAEAAAGEVRSFLHDKWGVTHATLEAETGGCGREQLLGEWTAMQ